MQRKAIGIVRVSQVRGRGGDDFASPEDQRERIESECKRRNLQLIETIEELDVKGGTPLAKRDGIRRAIESVEDGSAAAIVVAYFDRLVRSLRIQEEILERVESAGGRVLAVDFGEVSGKTSAQWLSTTLLGAVNQYHGKVLAERVRGAQKRALDRGVAPWKNTTPGYTRNADGVFEPNETAPAVEEAFRMRARGKSLTEIRNYLREHGVNRCRAAVGRLFKDRAVLGELHFGDLVNLEAHTRIVDPETFQAAQGVSAPRGRQPKSDRLLARLGVLQCANCGSRLCVSGTRGKRGGPDNYRCRNDDCNRRVTISAAIPEGVIVDAVKAALSDVEGRASVESNAREAERKLDQDEANLQRAIATLEDFMDEPAATDKIRKLRAARDESRERVKQLGGDGRALTVSVADWDRLTLDERRGLIRAVIARATVAPGRGAERVTVKLVGE
jgi:site-specific DNA recombinase